MWPMTNQLVPAKYTELGREGISVACHSLWNTRNTLTPTDTNQKLSTLGWRMRKKNSSSSTRSTSIWIANPYSNRWRGNSTNQGIRWTPIQTSSCPITASKAVQIHKHWRVGHGARMWEEEELPWNNHTIKRRQLEMGLRHRILFSVDGDTPTPFQPFPGYRAMLNLMHSGLQLDSETASNLPTLHRQW